MAIHMGARWALTSNLFAKKKIHAIFYELSHALQKSYLQLFLLGDHEIRLYYTEEMFSDPDFSWDSIKIKLYNEQELVIC